MRKNDCRIDQTHRFECCSHRQRAFDLVRKLRAESSKARAAISVILTRMRIRCALHRLIGFMRPKSANVPATARKKRAAVNLTLNESLVAQTNTFTGNLSATMETLLADYVSQQQQVHLSRQQAANACVQYWNEVLAAEGSFADEHSTPLCLGSTYIATRTRYKHPFHSQSSFNPRSTKAIADAW